jgi:hypothetical protein
MSTNLPAVISDQAIMPTTFEGMMKQAEVLVQSGLLPASIKSPAAALAVMLAGREMGLGPMHAFRVLYPVNGNVTISAQYMAARLIMAGVTYDVPEMTDKACEIHFKRDNGMTLTYRYTIEDAQRAGLTNKPNWRGFPKDMLYNRCMALGARKIAPDVLEGFYTPDEIDSSAVVNAETGEVIDVVARVVEEPKPQPTARGWDAWGDAKQMAFWTAATKMGLSKDVVHLGFGVESMKDCQNTIEEARAVLAVLDFGVNQAAIGTAGILEALGETPAALAMQGIPAAEMVERINGWLDTQTRSEEIPL